MGYALATEAAARGWHVDLVTGPVNLTAPPGVRVLPVVSAKDMYAASETLFEACDLFIAVAAVSDYRPKVFSKQKQKKQGGAVLLELVPTVDILKMLATRKRPGQVVVGFAAETEDVEAQALRKLVEKKLDWVVANDVSRATIGMNADDNAVTLLGADGSRQAFGPAPKAEVAKFILSGIALKSL